MKRIIKEFFKTYLSYSKSDRNAIVILCSLILLSVIINFFVKNYQPESSSDFSEIKRLFAEWEKENPDNNLKNSTVEVYLFNFNPNTVSKPKLDSLALPDFVKRNIVGYRNAGGTFSSPEDVRKIYGMNDSVFNLIKDYIIIEKKKEPGSALIETKRELSGFFDPNTADKEQLEYFGFSNFQISNLTGYRNSGGVFRSEADLLKIYGIDSVFFSGIEKHIEINEVKRKENKQPEEITFVEINSADSAGLVKLKGIGPSYASRILKYKNLLGGYYNKKQLLEIYHFREETYIQIQNLILIDTLLIKPLRLNFADYPELLRHPYLNKMHVEAILARRETKGAFKNISELQELQEMDAGTFTKIRPYITCR